MCNGLSKMPQEQHWQRASTGAPMQGSCCFRHIAGSGTMQICCAHPLTGLRWAARCRCCHLNRCWLAAGALSPCALHIETADLVHHPLPTHVCPKCSPSGKWWRCQTDCHLAHRRPARPGLAARAPPAASDLSGGSAGSGQSVAPLWVQHAHER